MFKLHQNICKSAQKRLSNPKPVMNSYAMDNQYLIERKIQHGIVFRSL